MTFELRISKETLASLRREPEVDIYHMYRLEGSKPRTFTASYSGSLIKFDALFGVVYSTHHLGRGTTAISHEWQLMTLGRRLVRSPRDHVSILPLSCYDSLKLPPGEWVTTGSYHSTVWMSTRRWMRKLLITEVVFQSFSSSSSETHLVFIHD